ncbi:hypothetical protein [Maribacter sp. 2-571]|uniref:hypothetical protein n=1 Tax=Maribacter sp. 2-571 TaxID=3417569 RepID=UPI003D338873
MDRHTPFLIDGIGALLSAVLVGTILIPFQPLFGMPRPALVVLGSIAIVFAFYSFSCFALKPFLWHRYLRGIALANLLYCVLTTGLVLRYYTKMTFLGLGYFFLEIVLILVLVRYELHKAKSG